MSKTITQIQQNEQDLASLLNNQTSIIDATLNIMRKSEEAIESQSQDLENFSKSLGNQIRTIEDEIHTDKVSLSFVTLAMQFLMIATSLQTTYASLLDVLLSSHQGHVNTQLISPPQLKDELVRIKASLPSGLRFPAEKDDLASVYRLMTIQGITNSKHVIFRLQLTLLEPESYNIFKTIPVPVTINDTFIAVKPASSYIIINDHRDRYYLLSDQELTQCTQPALDTYLCRERHPIYKVGSRTGSCEIAMLNHLEPPADCYMMTMDDSPYWYKLRATNQWLFSMPRRSAATFICNQSTTQITLEMAGIAMLNGSCVLKQQHITIHGYAEITTQSRPSIVPIWNLTQMVIPSHLFPLLHPLQHYQSSALELNALKHQVDSLPRLSTHDVHQYILGYILVAILILTAAYCGWRKKLSSSKRSPPQPAPRQHTASTFTVNLDPSTTN